MNLFTRVPTDRDMCCAINAEYNLKESEYKRLVEKMQKQNETQKVKSRAVREKGLSLTGEIASDLYRLSCLDI